MPPQMAFGCTIKLSYLLTYLLTYLVNNDQSETLSMFFLMLSWLAASSFLMSCSTFLWTSSKDARIWVAHRSRVVHRKVSDGCVNHNSCCLFILCLQSNCETVTVKTVTVTLKDGMFIVYLVVTIFNQAETVIVLAVTILTQHNIRRVRLQSSGRWSLILKNVKLYITVKEILTLNAVYMDSLLRKQHLKRLGSCFSNDLKVRTQYK